MTSEAVINQWYPVAWSAGLPSNTPSKTKLLGQNIVLLKGADGSVSATNGQESPLPVIERFDHIWTSLGEPKKDMFEIPEAMHKGRRHVPCGRINVKCSPLRAVENFLDIAHFPYVHTGILGIEDHPEVEKYNVEIDEELDEVWAKKVKFFQPQAAVSAEGGIITEYMYRVPLPTVSILYKTCPAKPGEWDIITLFVQPVGEDCCAVWPWMALYDDDSELKDLIHFQQMIFLQDRSILENQIPRLLPLDPRLEIPTRADMTSVAYRRWLKKRGLTYGAQTVAA